MEEQEKKLNIYQKLQKCRVELNKKNITKTGNNKYSNYQYFELSDFMPSVNELFYINGLSSEFNLLGDTARLIIIDVDDLNSQIIFEIPVAEVNIKGSSAIQSLGGQITYLRRYLYIDALEIAESDIIDVQGQGQDNKPSEAEEELKFIYMTKMNSLELETDTDHEKMLEHFKVKSNNDMTLKQIKEAVAILETKKKKNKEEVF